MAEITRVKCEDLDKVESPTADGSIAADWMVTVVGKGGRSRQVAVPRELVDELVRHGLERGVLRGPGASHGLRLHDFRQRFAVLTLLHWYQCSDDAERGLPVHSTYLGHIHVADTYRSSPRDLH